LTNVDRVKRVNAGVFNNYFKWFLGF
jgi:hypothetical protein